VGGQTFLARTPVRLKGSESQVASRNRFICILGVISLEDLNMMMSRLLRSGALIHGTHKRFFSADPLLEPWKFVQGLTAEDVEKNETIAAFLRANFKADDDMRHVGRVDDAVEAVADEAVEKDDASDRNIRKISCFRRHPIEEEGSRRCRNIRDNLEIPGLLYGGDPFKGIHSEDESSRIYVKTAWKVLQRELDLYHRAFESRVYDLTVFEDETDTEGTVHRVVPTNVQRHPIQNKLFCVNYLRYHAMRPIQIPIVYVNEEESPAMKRGGFIAPVKRYVSCMVDEGVPIPERLELECTGLQLREVVRLDRIIFPEGVKISKQVKPDRFVIGTVFGRRADQADDA
jgi:large subunit ribosomal protein L25